MTTPNRGFKFTPSASQDVVAYRVTLLRGPGIVGTKDYPAGELTVEADGKITIDLAGDPAFPNLDGQYDVQVAAVDDGGNVSPPLAGSLTLDFVAPEAPTAFEPF